MSRMRHVMAGVAVCAAVIASTATSVQPAIAGKAGSKPASTVTVKDLRFRPTILEATTGVKVTWKNKDSVGHTVTSGAGAPKKFDGDLAPGEKFSVKLPKAGTYEYVCTIHPSMRGTVIVS